MRRRQTIYIVDADAHFRRSLARTLRSRDIDTRAFENASDVIDASRYIVPGCFLIDLGIPDAGGIELIRTLTALRPEMPLILMAEAATARIAVRALQAGAVDILERPFDDATMLMMIWEALGTLRQRVRDHDRASTAKSRVAQLTPRELDVFKGVIAGRSSRAIGDVLGIGMRTVEMHRANMMRKMGASSQPELSRMATLAGFDPHDDDEG